MHYLFPVETIVRELDFRINLAFRLATSGDQVLIGRSDLINGLASSFPGSVYVGKNIFSFSSSEERGFLLSRLKKHGIFLVYLHEEGGVYPGDIKNTSSIMQSHYNLDLLTPQSSIVCTWGDYQRECDSMRAPHLAGNIFSTGHPRFDLCKPEYSYYYKDEVSAIRRQYKKLILINSNFSIANHGLGSSYVGKLLHEDNLNHIDVRIAYQYAHTKHMMNEFYKLIYQLSTCLKEYTIVYRPHPSENAVQCRSHFKPYPNVSVDDRGSVVPWILASSAIIHNGCTTSIEAYFAGANTISYIPFENEPYDFWLPNSLGQRASCLQEVIDHIYNPKPLPPPSTTAKRLIKNFDADSFSLLCGQIRKIDASPSPVLLRNLSLSLLKDSLKTAVKRSIPLPYSTERSYLARKFTALDKNSVHRKVELSSQLHKKEAVYEFLNSSLIRLSFK